jgi:hypothetical protein
MTCIALIAVMNLLGAAPALADVGVTDACQDDIKDLQDKINDNKDDYTAESRRKAKAQLSVARTNRMNPVKCRSNILTPARNFRKEGGTRTRRTGINARRR